MKILHLSSECYPAAKTGGLADVVGALPKYSNQAGHNASVIIPGYHINYIVQHKWSSIHKGSFYIDREYINYHVMKLDDINLGFDLYMVDIPGKFDRSGIYADPDTKISYSDEPIRWIAFQRSVLEWLNHFDDQDLPDVLHCHDHHTGLISFMVKYSPYYTKLSNIPTIFTIHNGLYQGVFGWNMLPILPPFPAHYSGFIDWNNRINPMASGIKNSWRFTTVSPTYMKELAHDAFGLETLIAHEYEKSAGIVNGIDTEIWDPGSDSFLEYKLKSKSKISIFKEKNKKDLQQSFEIDLLDGQPVFAFIGRLVNEKGAHIIPEMIRQHVHAGLPGKFIVLGTGQVELMNILKWLPHELKGRFDSRLEYNESLAHKIYAASDFLLMPSILEPCGLNQLYSQRYGTIPVVRATGGLVDTVTDIVNSNGNGTGIHFTFATAKDGSLALRRATELFSNTQLFNQIRQNVLNQDFSWAKSTKQYINLYKSLVLA